MNEVNGFDIDGSLDRRTLAYQEISKTLIKFSVTWQLGSMDWMVHSAEMEIR